MSGPNVVNDVPTMHRKSVSMLLGNMLPGGKVTIHPKLVLEPDTSIQTENGRRKTWIISFICCDSGREKR